MIYLIDYRNIFAPRSDVIIIYGFEQNENFES